uniref:Uncharacterized protein n=1 Tax=Strigamia maritima TaxID=126957 RepID=T1IK72_STRMM
MLKPRELLKVDITAFRIIFNGNEKLASFTSTMDSFISKSCSCESNISFTKMSGLLKAFQLLLFPLEEGKFDSRVGFSNERFS